MKSSSRVFKNASSGNCFAWTPPVFDSSEEIDCQEQAAEMLHLFMLNQPAGSDPARGRSGYIPADKAEGLRAWHAVDLEYTPPFTEEAGEPPAEFIGIASMAGRQPKTILEEARSQAQELIRQAEEQAGTVRLKAADEMEAMRQAGYRDGMERAQAEMAAALQACADLVAEAHAWQANLASTSEEIVLEMIREMAKAVFGEGVALDEQALQMNLNRVVENASALGDLKIYLHPLDAARLDPAWKEYQSLVLGSKVQIIPAEGITRGGCYIQGQMGAVDARVETQMRNVLTSFVEAQVSGEAN
ncbi:MAG: FliH/SctL family protein [Chloroflexota bacterium]|jgi:flagellar assembly protein FliH